MPVPFTELTLIDRIRRLSANRASSILRLGIGDDCAILAPPRGHELLVTTDLLLESRHFRRDWHSPASAGHRCLARGLSDLAAMGAKPLAAFLSLALPPDTDPKWVEGFLKGLLNLAQLHAVPLAGGDTAQAPGPHILADIVLLGSAPAGRALRRSTARPGDLLYVSGALGGAAAQLASLSTRKPGAPFLAPLSHAMSRSTPNSRPNPNPQTHPEPRLALGHALLRRSLATAAMDLSDGLSTDLTHLCEASRVQAVLDSAAIPLHPLAQGDLALALHGGEDYELLFTASPGTKIPRTLAGVPLTRIGRITRRDKRRPLLQLDDQPLIAQGWQHFVS
jgi:thiamine-monophosphate kinase